MAFRNCLYQVSLKRIVTRIGMIEPYDPVLAADHAIYTLATPDRAVNSMNNGSGTSVVRARAWLVWLCIIVFAAACIAEPAHFHSTSAPSRQHCSLCIASHSVARPAPFVSTIAAPAHCLGLLAAAGVALPDFQAVLALYIRPPPSV